MAALSIERAIRGARAFAAREWRLVLPVALAFVAIPAFLFQLMLPNDGRALSALLSSGDPAVRNLIVTSVPLLVINLYGLLSIAVLAQVPSISVGEALGMAARRFPAVLLSGLSVFGGLAVAMLLLAIVLAAVLLVTKSVAVVQAAPILILSVATIVLMTRLTPLIPLMADRILGPLDGLKGAWRLTRGHFWRLFGFSILFFIGSQVVALALNSALGSILLLIGRVSGMVAVADGLRSLLAALIGMVMNVAYTLIVVSIYRQLAGMSRGI